MTASPSSPAGDVYVLTYKGCNELQAAETALTPLQLELLVLIDGRADTATVRGRLKSAASDAEFAAALAQLVKGGYIDLSSNQLTMSPDFLDFFGAAASPLPADAVDRARPAAESGVTTLQQNGYYVRIAMRGPAAAPAGQRLHVLVVEDDATLAKFLRQYLELEGFSAAIAANRAEIVAGLRRQPPPDLVLLDVVLPDADGFNVLLKMREHPALKTVPVLMLTAKATRESVLKGLAGGANGYITKPFQPENLIAAVKTVLGLSRNPFDREGGRVE
jgi:CheY-like chemotaxis protein